MDFMTKEKEGMRPETMQGVSSEAAEEKRLRVPAVALRGLTVLPGMVVHFALNRGKSILAVEKAMLRDQRLYLVAQMCVAEDDQDFEGV